MQCQPVRCSHITFHDDGKSEKETIHSGHFMVSDFEAEAQDDEYNVAVPVPDAARAQGFATPPNYGLQVFSVNNTFRALQSGHLAIETDLAKLFQCMSLAYRQKLTSPKWNRFKGIRLRWKDKIRLNNVIWRCWHMQFIKKDNTLICQFASPLDEGIHNKPEAVVLEGKYWKRKLAAVTAEYKKWRMFYRNKIMGWAGKEYSFTDSDLLDWHSPSTEGLENQQMMVDEDYMDLMSDTLFSTITSNQPFAFPDIREIARGAGIADFIQPSLVQLQPNLDEFMDAPELFQEFFSSKLPPVPEDCAVADATYRHSIADIAPTTENPPPVVTAAAAAAANVSYGFVDPKPSYFPVESEITETEQAKFTFGDAQSIKTTRIYLSNKEEAFYSVKGKETMSSASNESFGFPQAATYKTAAPAPAPAGATTFNVYPSYDVGTRLADMPVQNLQKTVERSASLPSVAKEEVFAMPKVQLKSRHRSRSGSSLLTGKSRFHPAPPPPPLLSSNSDPNLNLSRSALLAQLLTTTPTGIYNVTNVANIKSATVPILPMPSSRGPNNPTNPTTLLITTGPIVPATQGYLNTARTPASPESPIDCNAAQIVTSPPLSSPLYHDPLSPKRTDVPERNKTPPHGSDHRRACHINAEQKRRYNIRNGFETLHALIPHLQQNPNVKLSKAAMLQKGAEYIKQLQTERLQMKEEIEGLRYQIESLNSAISNCQSMLPATGAPVSRHRTTKMKEMFDEWVRVGTNENWRFWIFSVLFEPLLTSFNCSVSTASYEDLYRSTLMWVEQHCSLSNLRPAVTNSLKSLSTSTEILNEPEKLPDEARAAVARKHPQGPS